MERELDLTILMPCLDEAETLAACIHKAKKGLEESGLRGEILIADNGSRDDSPKIAEKEGARVVHVAARGYGSALRAGVEAARGRWIIMADADDSYDFAHIASFIEKLKQGCDLVVGCRLPAGGGTIMPGAMPWLHRWLGNPVLSGIGRLFFASPVRDFHCGMRAFSRDAFKQMELQTTGMEFASEMVIQSTLKKLRISEVPITLHPDGRSHPPHLKTWRDGWRHLRFMLLFTPRWLFLYPGIALALFGLVTLLLLARGPVHWHGATLDTGSLATAGTLILIGNQLMTFAFFTKVFAMGEGLLPQDQKFSKWFSILNLERGLFVGFAVLACGCALLARAWLIWRHADFGPISYPENLRRVIPAGILITLGIQVVFSSFFMSVLGLRTMKRTPPQRFQKK